MQDAYVFNIEDDGRVVFCGDISLDREGAEGARRKVASLLTERQAAVIVCMDTPVFDWAGRNVHIKTRSEVVLSPDLQEVVP